MSGRIRGVIERLGARGFGYVRADALDGSAWMDLSKVRSTRPPRVGDRVEFLPVTLPDDRLQAWNVVVLTDDSEVSSVLRDSVASPHPTNAWTVTPPEIEDLVAMLLDPTRRIPIVVITSWKSGSALIDATVLADRISSQARVVCIETGPATWALSEVLPRRLDVYGEAARVFWPGLTMSSDPYTHPLFIVTTPQQARDAVEKIAAMLREPFDEARVPDSNEIPSVASQHDDLLAELETAIADRSVLMERLKAANEQIAEFRKRLRGAEDRYRNLEQRAADVLDPLSSELAFLAAVRVEYARKFDEADRLRYPLQKMRLAREFLDRLRQLEGIDLAKIVEVCAQVAAGRAHEIPARAVHELRSKEVGAGRGRASNGARAWRCSLQDGTPAARRLHWWLVPGTGGATIEFANVAIHDDFSI